LSPYLLPSATKTWFGLKTNDGGEARLMATPTSKSRTLHRLSAAGLAKLPAGLHCDGGNLNLRVDPNGARHWAFRYSLNGKAHELGLGKFPVISLVKARELAAQHRITLALGNDPLERRRAQRAATVVEAAKAMTFRECADRYLRAHGAKWTNAKHAAQWADSLKAASEVFGAVPVAAIDTALVMKLLELTWHTTPETTMRLRGRVEAVLDWATARELRSGDNPARWRGHLKTLLPARGDIRKVEHHAAMPYAEIGGLMQKLRADSSIASAALQFLILNASRAGEVRLATWDEIKGDVWTIPAERMKAGAAHRIPMSPAALAILKALPRTWSPLLFPGRGGHGRLGPAVFIQLMGRVRPGHTVHGFRSTFKDWARERTNFADDISEAALAHKVNDKVKAAYQRTDFFDKRRKLMEMWGQFCSKPAAIAGSKVVAIRRA
jgi:integrase